MTVFTWDAGDGSSTADWTGPSNWDQKSSYPQAGDTAILNAGFHKCYVNASITCTAVTIAGDAADTVLELQADLEVTGDLLITSGIMNLGAGNYTLTVGGDLSLLPIRTGGTGLHATLTCGDADVIAGDLETWGYYHSGGYDPKCVFTGGTGDHEYGSVTFMVGTDVVLSSGITEITGGGVAFRDEVQTGYNTYDNGGGTVKFTSASDQLLYSTGVAANDFKQFYNLILEKTSSTLQGMTTVGFHIRVENDLTITSGILNTKTTSPTLLDHDLTVEGDTKITGTLTGNDSTMVFGTDGVFSLIEAGALWIESTGSLTFGSADLTVYGGLTAKGSNTLTNTDASGDIILGGRTNNGMVFSHSNQGINISGDIILESSATGAFDCRDDMIITCGTFKINNAIAYNMFSNEGDNVSSFILTGNLNIDHASSSLTTLNTDVVNLTVSGVVTINGTLTCNSSTVIFGSGGVKSVNGTGTINCDTATITCSDNFGSAGDGLTINMDTASLDIVDRFGDAAGVVIVSGVSEPTISCLRFMKTDLTPGHSTVTLDGNGIYGALGLGAGTFWNVVVNTGDGENKEITSDITIDNDLTITAGGLDTTTDDYDPTILGNFTLGSGCEYLTNDSVTTIKGNWINNGGSIG